MIVGLVGRRWSASIGYRPTVCAARQLAHTDRICAQRDALHRQLPVEQHLEVGAQSDQLGAQSSQFLGIGAHLATNLRLDAHLVFASRGDFALELQLVDGLQISGLGLVHCGFTSILRHRECAGNRGPGSSHHADPKQWDALGED
ncbi:hypothetical protein FGL95_17920 [Nocardiaceae bacterium YC2-7]|uniref:Uncharacterized protein n=1 Tax=Antrihabitans stalactiti TaxID=2584121 RepID=A0A848KGS9_9NOCA|nr:hypothetical protein [Antrihabitans stalactiti]